MNPEPTPEELGRVLSLSQGMDGGPVPLASVQDLTKAGELVSLDHPTLHPPFLSCPFLTSLISTHLSAGNGFEVSVYEQADCLLGKPSFRFCSFQTKVKAQAQRLPFILSLLRPFSPNLQLSTSPASSGRSSE